MQLLLLLPALDTTDPSIESPSADPNLDLNSYSIHPPFHPTINPVIQSFS